MKGTASNHPFPRPRSVRTDGSNAFAYHSMASRVPGIILDTLAYNSDYPLIVKDNLKALHDAVTGNAPLRLFSAPAPDHHYWAEDFETYAGETWLGTEWLFAEMLLYRLMVEASQYWTTLRDPFAPFKQEEMESDTLWRSLSAALAASGNREEHLARLFTFALWGNRIDLSLKATAAMGTTARDEHLLANDIPAVVNHLLGHDPGSVHFIMDNAGTEQAMDLVLVDHLLQEHIAHTVILHVKMQPVLVSDAIVADVHALLDRMHRQGGEASTLAARLRSNMNEGRLHIVPDFHWNTAGRLWELPARIHAPMQRARLVISKGDLNYRRATNDAIWPAGVSLAEAIQTFPAPLLALRTLKCDTLVGISSSQIADLDTNGEPNWRTSGAYGVAQFVKQQEEDA